MKQSTFLAWIYRMPLIKRWGLMHTVKKENVAEHSHMVAVIAHLLTVIRNKKYDGNLSPEKAATVAIYHEISESKLQDLNHVTKYHNPEFTREFKKLEKLSEIECLVSLPSELQNSFSDLLVQDEVSPEYKRIVKAADIISAYIKACDEIKFGNVEFVPVKDKLKSMLITYQNELPEVEYFMDVFAENCLVSVDKLAEQDH